MIINKSSQWWFGVSVSPFVANLPSWIFIGNFADKHCAVPSRIATSKMCYRAKRVALSWLILFFVALWFCSANCHRRFYDYSCCSWGIRHAFDMCIIQKLLTFPLKLRFIFRSFQRWKIDFNLCFLIQPHWHTHTPHDTTCSLLATNPRLHHLISYLRCHSSQMLCSPHRIYDARCVLFPNLTSHLAEKVSDKWYRCLH